MTTEQWHHSRWPSSRKQSLGAPQCRQWPAGSLLSRPSLGGASRELHKEASMEKYYLGKVAHWPTGQAPTRPASNSFDLLSHNQQQQQQQQQQQPRCKLVEIQYLRRPPTLGLLYLGSANQSSHDQAPTSDRLQQPAADGQAVCIYLSALTLASNNSAGLQLLRQISLRDLVERHHSNQQQQQQQQQQQAPRVKLSMPFGDDDDSVVDFDTNGTVLIDGSATNQQQFAQSCCVLLTGAGQLIIFSLIDCSIKYVLNLLEQHLIEPQQPQQPAVSGKRHLATRFQLPSSKNEFVRCKLKLLDDGQVCNSMLVYVLSKRRYQCYEVSVRQLVDIGSASSSWDNSNKQISKLLNEFQLDASKGLRLHNFHVINWPLAANQAAVVMLEVSDQTIRIIKQSACIYSGLLFGKPLKQPLSISSVAHRMLVLPASLAINQPANVIHYSKRKLSSYSLLIDYGPSEIIGDNVAGKTSLMEQSNEIENDPDHLLLREPSFELELCWSISLNDIDSIRSLDDFEDDDDEGADAEVSLNACKLSNDQLIGCLCPIWSIDQPDENCWPKFLALTYKHHLLFYSFEQETSLPFSVVYDRAFLQMNTDSVSSQSLLDTSAEMQPSNKPTTNTNPRYSQEMIDLRLKPKLLHNFKLIGAQPTDSLFNTLFLVSKINIINTRQLNQLGLLFCLSNQGDLLALKIKSHKIVKQMDNVYQKLLVDSLRQGSMLRDEISRLELINGSLRSDIANLEKRNSSSSISAASSSTSASAASPPTSQQAQHLLDNLDRILQVELNQDDQIDGLFNLEIFCSNLIQIKRIVIISTVNSFILNQAMGQSSDQSIESIRVENCYNNDNDDDICQAVILANNSTSNEQLLKGNNGTNGTPSTIKSSSDREYLLDDPLDSATMKPKALAIIKLIEQRLENVKLSLPIFLTDGQFGQIRAYFILSLPTRRTSIWRSLRSASRLISGDLSLNDEIKLINHPSLQLTATPTSAAKYYKKTVPIKPLLSYKLPIGVGVSSGQEGIDNETDYARELEVGSRDLNELTKWLNECLQKPIAFIDDADKLNPRPSSYQAETDRHSPGCVRLESSFTHCYLECRRNFTSQSEGILGIKSNDFMALELIRRHLLKRATDQSIKLDLKHSVPTFASLKHLIKCQKINLDQTWSMDGLRARNFSRHLNGDVIPKQLIADSPSIELLLENLLTDWNRTNNNGSSDVIPQEFIKFPYLLEKSFRQDVERLFEAKPELLDKNEDDNYETHCWLDEETTSKKNKRSSHQRGQLWFIMREIICGFLIDALVDYSNLRNDSKISEQKMLIMRQKLLLLTDDEKEFKSFKSGAQFADRVMNEWTSLKSI